MAAYRIRPAPPKKASTTKPTRRMSGSMSRWRASPPATPATLRSVVERRSRARSRTSSPVTRGPSWGRRRREPAGPVDGVGRGLREGVVVMAPACSRRGAATIGDDPDPAPSRGVRCGSGSGRGVASWSGPARCVTIGPRDEHHCPRRRGTRRARRTPRHPRHPGTDHRRGRGRVWRATSACRCCGCGRASWCSPRSAASACSSTPGCGWCCPPTARSRTRLPASRGRPAADAARAGSAGSPTSVRPSCWPRSASAPC